MQTDCLNLASSRWMRAQMKHDLKTGVSEEEVRLRVETKKYGFEHVSFAKYNRRQQEQDDYITNPYEVEDGVVQCGRCGSNKVYSVSVQTRGGDEPMSVRAKCTMCNKQWVQNN